MRTNEETRSTVAIILASSSSERDLCEAYWLGANSYLIKPTHPDAGIELMRAFKTYWLTNNHFPPSDGRVGSPMDS